MEPPKLPTQPPSSEGPPALPQRKPAKKKGLGIFGKLCVLIAVAFGCFVAFRMYQAAVYLQNNPRVSAPGEAEFRAANRAIVTDKQGVYQGNTDQAVAMASEFSVAFEALRDEFFTQSEKKGISLSRGHFITYCNLQPRSCALLVHVPELRKFDSDAKESLNKLAWITAWETAKKLELDIDELAVGVKGVLSYSAISIGRYDPEADSVGPIRQKSKGMVDTKLLHRFFAPATIETPAATTNAVAK